MRSRIFTLSLLLALLLAGCASAPPTFGDRVMADGQARVDIAQQWEQGSAAATRGEAQVKQGRRLLEKGRAELREGEAWIAAGNAAVQNSR